MPWCEECSKFWNLPDMPESGCCPSCGRLLAPPASTAKALSAGGGAGDAAGGELGDAGQPGHAAALTRAKGAPWHFKLLVVGVTVYMVYRIYWLIEWLPKHV